MRSTPRCASPLPISGDFQAGSASLTSIRKTPDWYEAAYTCRPRKASDQQLPPFHSLVKRRQLSVETSEPSNSIRAEPVPFAAPAAPNPAQTQARGPSDCAVRILL